MADIEQTSVLARPQMFGNDAFELDRHRITGETDHARAEAAVQGIKRQQGQRQVWIGQLKLRRQSTCTGKALCKCPHLSPYLRAFAARLPGRLHLRWGSSAMRPARFPDYREYASAVPLPERFRGRLAPSAAGLLAPPALSRAGAGITSDDVVELREMMPRVNRASWPILSRCNRAGLR